MLELTILFLSILIAYFIIRIYCLHRRYSLTAAHQDQDLVHVPVYVRFTFEHYSIGTANPKEQKQVYNSNNIIYASKELKIPYSFEQYINHLYSTEQWMVRHNSTRYLFHYTSFRNARSILQEMRIKVAVSIVAPFFGQVIFLTRVEPTENNFKLFSDHYNNNTEYIPRLQCVFAIKASSIRRCKVTDSHHPNRDTWFTRSDIELKTGNFMVIIR